MGGGTLIQDLGAMLSCTAPRRFARAVRALPALLALAGRQPRGERVPVQRDVVQRHRGQARRRGGRCELRAQLGEGGGTAHLVQLIPHACSY